MSFGNQPSASHKRRFCQGIGPHRPLSVITKYSLGDTIREIDTAGRYCPGRDRTRAPLAVDWLSRGGPDTGSGCSWLPSMRKTGVARPRPYNGKSPRAQSAVLLRPMRARDVPAHPGKKEAADPGGSAASNKT